MWRKGNPHALLLDVSIGAATMGKSTEIPQKIRKDLPYDSPIPFLGICPKNTKTLIQKDT